MNDMMDSLQLVAPGRFEPVRVPRPRPQPGQALVAFGFGMLCGTDSTKVTGIDPRTRFPLAAGTPLHECVGSVAASAIAGLEPGTRVLAIPEGETGLAECFVASRNKIVALDDWNASDLPLAPLAQPVATVIAALDRLGEVAGKDVLLIGLGGIGLAFATLLSLAGARRIMAVDPNAFRRSLAAGIANVDTAASWHEGLIDGYDIAIDAVGHAHQDEILNHCLMGARPRGTVLIFGTATRLRQKIDVDRLLRKNLQMVGSINPDWSAYLSRGADLVRAHLDRFSPLVTHRFHWQDAGSAFSLFHERDAARVKILLGPG